MFKRIIGVVIIMFCGILNYYSQNIVPNCSFEDTVVCPWNTAGFAYGFCSGWHTYSASPDYYNSCSPQGWVSVPENIYGYQQASTGHAYGGIVVWVMNDTFPGIQYESREIIGTELSEEMIIGETYHVSFKVSLTRLEGEEGFAVNKLGMLLLTYPYDFTGVHPYDDARLVNNYAQLYTDSIISDSAKWTLISGSFIADSAYTFVAIGNFFENSLVDSLQIADSVTNLWNTAAYYYIDDVCITKQLGNCSCDSTNFISEIVSPALRIWPNPAGEIIHISCDDCNREEFKAIIYDTFGMCVYKKQYCSNSQEFYIDISKLIDGFYYMVIISKQNSYTKTFIKTTY